MRITSPLLVGRFGLAESKRRSSTEAQHGLLTGLRNIICQRGLAKLFLQLLVFLLNLFGPNGPPFIGLRIAYLDLGTGELTIKTL